MRKRTLFAGIFVLLICVALLLNKAFRQRPSDSLPLDPGQTNTQTVARPSEIQPARNAQSFHVQDSVSLSSQRPETERSNAIWQEIQADWQKPIDFYGRVLDEKSNSVQGASIRFQWADRSEDEHIATTESDADGLFSLHGKSGRSLEVWVHKPGYYASHGGYKGFLYSQANEIHLPDPQNPVIFNLRKKGTPGEGLVALKRNYRIPRDGAPISIDLVTGGSTSGESGNLVIRCWTHDQGKRSGEKYDWRCIVAVPGGGLSVTDEEFPFQAPDKEYKQSVEIHMPPDSTNWNSQVDLKFYYRLGDGRYGRVAFSMIAGGQHFFMIDSLLNPAGGRNLEPASSNSSKPHGPPPE